MSEIGNEDAWCEFQQTTNGIFRNKIDWIVTLDFDARSVVIGLQTDGNITGRQYFLQVIFNVLNLVASREYSDDFSTHVKLVLSFIDNGNRVESQQFDEAQSISFKR